MGDLRLEFLHRFLPYERGIPAHDTLSDVVNALDPDPFKDCFTAWVESLREAAPDIIAIDGKTSRRSHDRAAGRGPLHRAALGVALGIDVFTALLGIVPLLIFRIPQELEPQTIPAWFIAPV